MSVQDFFNKYNNKYVDFDGYYGYQCMDLYQQYNRDVVGAPRVAADPAYKVWTQNLYPKDFYTKIANTPNGIPVLGDVVVWGAGANGGYGHIAIFQKGDVWNFTSFDQNWPVNSKCHFQPHNYNYVLGWLRPKTAQNVSDQEKLRQIQQIVWGGDPDADARYKIRQILPR